MYTLKFITLTKNVKNHLKESGQSLKKTYSLSEANKLFEVICKTPSLKKKHNKIAVEIICPTGKQEYEFEVKTTSSLSTQVAKQIKNHLQESQALIEASKVELNKLEVDKFELENRSEDKTAIIKIKFLEKQLKSLKLTINKTKNELTTLKRHQLAMAEEFKILPPSSFGGNDDDFELDETEAVDDENPKTSDDDYFYDETSDDDEGDEDFGIVSDDDESDEDFEIVSDDDDDDEDFEIVSDDDEDFEIKQLTSHPSPNQLTNKNVANQKTALKQLQVKQAQFEKQLRQMRNTHHQQAKQAQTMAIGKVKKLLEIHFIVLIIMTTLLLTNLMISFIQTY